MIDGKGGVDPIAVQREVLSKDSGIVHKDVQTFLFLQKALCGFFDLLYVP